MRFRTFFLACLCTGPAVFPAETWVAIPFHNHSGNASLNWIGESVSQAIHRALVSEHLLAVGRDARVEVFTRLALPDNAILSRASIIKAAQALDAGIVIYGEYSVTQAPKSIRITAHTINVRRLTRGLEFEQSGALEDLAAIETRLAWRALKALIPEQAPPEEDFRRRFPPVRVDALEQYTRGLLATRPEVKMQHFSQAARLAGRYSAPSFELGRLFVTRRAWREAAEWFSKVAADDPHYRDARFQTGVARFELGEYRAAEQLFAEVAQAVPTSEVLNNLGAAQSRQNLDGALASFEKALEGDSADADYQFNAGYALWKRGEYARAADRFRASLDRQTDDAPSLMMLGRCLKPSRAGRPELRPESLERIKTNFAEASYLQLKAILDPASAR